MQREIKNYQISDLRQLSISLVRELGLMRSVEGPNNLEISHILWHALMEISKCEQICVQGISGILKISKYKASRSIGKLIKMELVESYLCKIDARKKLLRLTEKGYKFFQYVNQSINLNITQMLSHLEMKNLNIIGHGLEEYLNALRLGNWVNNDHQDLQITELPKCEKKRSLIIAWIRQIQLEEYGLVVDQSSFDAMRNAEICYTMNNQLNFWIIWDSNNSKPIGSIAFKEVNDEWVEMKRFFVDKKFRGKGVAHKLLNHLEKNAKICNAKNIILGTVSNKSRAFNFYLRNSYLNMYRDKLPKDYKCSPEDNFWLVKKIS